MRAAVVIGGMVLALAGCTGMDDGTQSIPVTTVPPGADCALSRGGSLIARISPTPGIVTLARSAEDLTFTCSKPGYQTATYVNRPIAQETTMADRIAVRLGQAYEGSNMLYRSPVTVTLAPVPAPKPARPKKIPFGALQPAPAPVPTPKVQSVPLPGGH